MDGCESIPVHQLWAWWKNPVGLLMFETLMLFALPYLRLRYGTRILLFRGGGPAILVAMGLLFARLLGMRILLECNGIAWDELRMRGFGRVYQQWTRFSTWQQATLAHCIIGVTPQITAEMIRLARRYPSVGVTVQNGADPDRFSGITSAGNRKAFGIAKDVFVVGCVGAFSPWHGVVELVEAVRQYKAEMPDPFYLLAVGDGPLLHQITCQTRGKIGEVILAGSATPNEIPGFMECFDVGIVFHNAPLIGKYGMSSLKFWEYAAAGLPVLVREDCNMGDIVRRHNMGYIIPNSDPASVVKALKEAVLDHKNGNLQRIGKRNRQTIRDNYTWRHAAHLIEECFLTR